MDIHQQFNHAFQGQPWHGKSSMEIIDASDPGKVFTYWIPGAHSIAELVLHLTVWTGEALDRLNGREAGTPKRGDWPPVLQKNAESWNQMKEDFRNAHRKLMERFENFTQDDWDFKTIDYREGLEEETADTYAQLVNGIIQHLAYHSGQISLLQKF
ncbi:DinB family protein [Flavihumibacter sp. R14]|nr:DinB family protein [Flavihumibacter soli]